MPKFKFNKLVRDKIVDHQIASGAKPRYRQLDDAEHKVELIKKIIEEAAEILHANATDTASEIADVQQALDDLKKKLGLTDAAITKAQIAKAIKNGAFEKGVFIDYVEVDEDDRWAGYYRNNASRYPEID